MNKKYEINVEGTKLLLEDKSHAGIFRQFWAHFVATDVAKTIETIKTVGIRTSSEPNFVAKNGQKKKNILIDGDFYVYGHLTPAAMLKTYEKFQLGWDGKWVVETKETSPEPTADVPTEENKTDELASAQAELDAELAYLESDEAAAEVETENAAFEERILSETETEKLEKSADSITKDALAQEEYGVDFEDLLPSQKGKITKKFNKMNTPEIQEEMELPEM